MAYYPTDIKVFQNKVNLQSVVLAEDVNQAYDEITSMQVSLGTGIQNSTWTGTFANSTQWPNLQTRLQNIEIGLQQAITTSVSTAGGSVITPAVATTLGLVIKGASSQTADLLQFKSSDGTVKGAIGFTDSTNATLVLKNITIDGGNA